MVGFCTFESEEKRAPKASYSFEKFELLQKINNIRLIIDGKSVSLNGEQRIKLIDAAHDSPNLNFTQIRKKLNIPENATFNFVKYDRAKTNDECEKATKFIFMKAYHDMRKVFDKKIESISIAQRNEIGRIFTLYKSENKLREALKETELERHYIDLLIENLGSFSKFGHLSIKALDKIIPHLEKGITYDKACQEAGYNFKGHGGEEKRKTISLKHLADETENTITSLVAKRALSQCAKVLNGIIREMNDSPVFINVELAREMSKPKSERDKIDKSMKDNRAENERLKKRISEEFGKYSPTGMDIVKLQLYNQQSGICPYSLSPLDITKLFDPGYVDVDHIIPYSISFDDTKKNKILVKAAENRQKGNRLPLEYLTDKRAEDFQVWVNSANLPYVKKLNLLKKEIGEEDLVNFKERNLTDTKTITSFMAKYLADSLEFAPFNSNRNRHVTAVNGAVTSMLRKRWGLSKIRADGDAHHAVDAVVVACATQGDINALTMENKIRSYYERREKFHITESGDVVNKDGEIVRKIDMRDERFPEPYDGFVAELSARMSLYPNDAIARLNPPTYTVNETKNLKPIFVSRMPKRTVSGAAHKETIRGIGENNTTVSKVLLNKLKLDKDGEITGYFNPGDDRLLYEALKVRLIQFDGNGEKAFAEPFFKPKSDGTPGPLVKKVKIEEKSTLNVAVHNKTGVADNDSMVRVDVFFVEDDGYYLVPIYVADTMKDELPNKAIVAYKPYDEWKVVDDKDFIFSLYPNDLIFTKAKNNMIFAKVNKESKLPDKKEIEDGFVYYKGSNITTGAMKIINHDNSYIINGLGAKTLKIFEKYQVDVLGNISKVGFEPRQGFGNQRR